jgi:HEAT repeat protein
MSGSFARIAKLLDEHEPESRRLAAQQIPRVRGPEAGQLLLRALGDADWRVRKEATAVASSVETRDDVLRALRMALEDRVNIGLRNAAVEAMIALGSDALAPAMEALVALDADGRKLAVEVLAGVPDIRGVRALEGALGDLDPNVRSAAAEALGRAGHSGEEARQVAIDALLTLLPTDDMFLKLAALDSLTRLEARLSWGTVGPFVSDPLLKRYALAAAAGSREPDAIAALAAAAGDASPTIAREAIIAIGDCVLEDPDNTELVELASKTMRPLARARDTVRAMVQGDESTHARGAAIAALGLIRDQNDVQLLVDALGDHELAEHAELALKLFGEEAIAPMVEAGRQGSPEVRGATLSLVPMLAPEEPGVLEMLREALHDTSSDVLAAATRVFAKSGAAEDLRHVARFALHGDARVSNAAWTATHALARRYEAAARAMVGDVDASSPEAVIGCIAIDALATVGASRAEDVAFLQVALSNGDPRARRAAVDALATIGDARAADTVAFALADEEPDVVLAAVRALGKLRRPDPLVALLASSREPTHIAAALRALAEADPERTLTVALPLVRTADGAVAAAAVEAIGSLGAHPARGDALFAALEHADPGVVKLAILELSHDLDARALARIGTMLDHDARDVRQLAAELLGQEASAASQSLLRARLEREKDPTVRDAIAVALSARHE